MQHKRTPHRIRWPSRQQWLRMALVAVLVFAYYAAFPAIYQRVGSAAFMLAVIPVLVASATLGILAGVATVVVLGWVEYRVAIRIPQDLAHGPGAGVLSAFAKLLLAVSLGGLRAFVLRVRRMNREFERQLAVRQQATESLRQSLELHRSLVDSLGEGVGLFDSQDRFLFANQAAEKILDGPASGLLGVALPDLLSEEGQWCLAANRESAVPGPVSYEVALGRDPSRILLVTETRFDHETSGGTRTLRVLRDVSERVRLEREQRELEVQVQRAQALQSLAVLAGGAAHDFNNILGGVLGNAELALLKLPGDIPPAVRTCLEEISRFAREAAELSKQMLAFAGRRGLTLEPADLNQVVGEVVQLLHSTIAARAALELDLAAELPTIRADPVQLGQVVLNLAMNAVEAMQDSRGRLGMRTTVERFSAEEFPGSPGSGDLRPGEYVVLTVSDTGSGMAAETRARIFEPFFSTKYAGRGMGLAATLGIIKAHRGAITVESSPGRGSTFRVAFPIATEIEHETSEPGLDQPPWRGSGTVLLVDDEPAVRAVSSRLLEELGFKVLAASDGEQGLELLGLHPGGIDLVILDLVMPKLDGFEALSRMRQLKPELSVVLTSGHRPAAIDELVRDRRILGFLGKPHTLAGLEQMLRRAFLPPSGPPGPAADPSMN